VAPPQRAQHLLERLIDEIVGVGTAPVRRGHTARHGVVAGIQLGERRFVAVPHLLQQLEIR
jgi:hypothetical protein